MLVGSVTQMGLGLLVFKSPSAPVAEHVTTVTVATGKVGAGNKGGVTYGGKKLCFVNVHLDSDDGKQKERKKSLDAVLKKSRRPTRRLWWCWATSTCD